MLNSVLCTQKENANNILYTFRVKKCFCASGSIKLMHTLVTSSCNGAYPLPSRTSLPPPRAACINFKSFTRWYKDVRQAPQVSIRTVTAESKLPTKLVCLSATCIRIVI